MSATALAFILFGARIICLGALMAPAIYRVLRPLVVGQPEAWRAIRLRGVWWLTIAGLFLAAQLVTVASELPDIRLPSLLLTAGIGVLSFRGIHDMTVRR